MAYKDFSPAQILTAGEVDTYLMRQAIMAFATSTARDAAITVPVEGMVAYLEDTNTFWFYNGTAWQNVGNVMRFASAAARSTALPSPVEGMVSYLQDTDELQVYNGSSWLTVVVTSDDEGFTTTGSVTANTTGVDGGMTLRTWTGSAIYQSLATGNMTGNEYCLITDGTDTILGSASGGATWVRSNADSNTNAIQVSASYTAVYGLLAVGSPTVVGLNTSSQLHVRADNAGGKGGEISIVNYATNTVGNSAALNFGVDQSTYGSDSGNAQIRATNMVLGNAATELGFYTWNGTAWARRFWIGSDGAVRSNYSFQGSMRLSSNYNQSTATSITVSSASLTSICSASLATNGNPVQIVATGDLNPVGGATWFYIYLYRNGSQVGNYVICESPANSQNNPWALSYIDLPIAGLHSFSVQVVRGGANAGQFGETGNGQAPSISVVELMSGV